jgi:hypothetical protein
LLANYAEKCGVIHKSFILYLTSTYMKIETALLMIGVIVAIAAGVIITIVSSAATSVFAQQAGTLVCHQGTTMEVNFHSVPAHLKHGDLLGPCVT